MSKQTLAQYKAEIDRLRNERHTLEDQEQQRLIRWVDSLQEATIPLYEQADEAEDDLAYRQRVRALVRSQIRSSYPESRARQFIEGKQEIRCDHCDTILVKTNIRGNLRHDTIACPGCGYFEEAWDFLEIDSLRVNAEEIHSLDYQFQTIIQIVALLMSQNSPFVRSIEDGRIVLELPNDTRPFRPFDLDKNTLYFKLEQEGNLVTIDLEGNPPEKEAPLNWTDHIQEEEEDPDAPLCSCGNPLTLGATQCKECQDKEILRRWTLEP